MLPSMTSQRHSLTSRSSGFIPLAGGPAADMADNDIPLSTVRSNASTGARKPKAAVATTTAYDSSPSANEQASGLHLRHAGRRRKLSDGLGRSGTGGSDDVRVNALGRLYAKIVGFSVVTRYMVYVVPVGLLLAAPLVVLAVTDNRTTVPLGSRKPETGDEIRGPPLFALFLWIEISWLSLWLAKMAAWFLPKIFIFFCGIVSKGVRKYATVLQNLNIALSLFFSALASWLTFVNLFSLANAQEIGWVVTLERVLRALFASSAMLLAEKAIVQLIGVSYHQRSFANRIKASKRDIYLLGLLYDASRTLFPMYCPEFAEEDYVINDSIEMMLRGKTGRKTPAGSATPMRFIGDVGRLGGKVTHAVGNIAHEITGKQVLNPNSAHSIVLEALEKRLPSEALGRRIWMSFVLEGKDALYLDDFREVLGSSYADEAEEAFDAIDSDMNGDISLDEMMRKVVEIGKERKAIGEGMKDIGQALRVFDKVLLFVVLLIVIIIFFFVFDTTTLRVLGSAGTALLSLSFVFATTTQEFLGSCIFLFVKHPYDVGDRVDISKVQMVVDRISLLYTVFTRIDVMQVVQVPNIQLNNLWIDNISRSKAMKESIELNVSYDTTFEDIELLRLEMEKFVRSPENSRDFQPDFSISVGGVGDLDKMILFVSIKHKSNWHNDSVRALRRSKFMCALALALKKIPIYGPGGGTEELGAPTNPSYSVTVSDEAAAAAREEAARMKDASRMVPTQSSKTDQEVSEAEQHAVSELNTRPLAVQTQGLWDYRDHPDDVCSATSHDDGRSRDIDSLRSELIKRASTRGRRRAGEGLHNLTHTDKSGHSGSLARAPSSRLEPFDEEAQTGISSPYRDLERGAAMPGQLATTQEEQEQKSLHPSSSQRSQRAGLHRGPSSAYKASTRGLTPGGHG